MRLQQLRIENFRGFESLTLDFHPEVTVLVGGNGSGKTTVLEAVVLVLANLLAPRDRLEKELWFSETDFRAGSRPPRSSLLLEHAGVTTTVRANHTFKDEGLTAAFSGGELRDLPRMLEGASSIPIACYYDVDRQTRDSTPRSRDAVYRTPMDAWKDAWNAKAGFHEFFQWFREREDLENADRVEHSDFTDLQLHAVRRAIEALLPGYSRPRIRRPRGMDPSQIRRPVLTVTKSNVELAFDQLSHGERLLVALAGDIARRLAIANPKSEDSLLGEGIVLIDEPDLHLHPEWQAKVIPALRRTFPNVQLVVTTHSLVVLSYVPSECVRLLQDFEVYDAPSPTEGREPNALASEIYGIPLRPADTLAEIDRVARLIHDQRLDEARVALDRLAEQLGDTDTDVVGLRTALAIEEI